MRVSPVPKPCSQLLFAFPSDVWNSWRRGQESGASLSMCGHRRVQKCVRLRRQNTCLPSVQISLRLTAEREHNPTHRKPSSNVTFLTFTSSSPSCSIISASQAAFFLQMSHMCSTKKSADGRIFHKYLKVSLHRETDELGKFVNAELRMCTFNSNHEIGIVQSDLFCLNFSTRLG